VGSTDDERRLVAALLDEIIPASADGRMPGAGELGLAERVITDLSKQPGLLELVRVGLAALDRVARGERGDAFAALPAPDRKGILEQIVQADPAFVSMLLFPTYVAYYEHPRVLAGLGREPRPPHPKGYELEPFDPTLLDVVRKRAPLFREC